MCERQNFELQSSAAHDSLCRSGACCKTKRNSPSSFFSHGKRPATPAKRAQVMHMIMRETTQKFENLQRLKRKFKNKITFPSNYAPLWLARAGVSKGANVPMRHALSAWLSL
jgi:hypothetical protein